MKVLYLESKARSFGYEDVYCEAMLATSDVEPRWFQALPIWRYSLQYQVLILYGIIDASIDARIVMSVANRGARPDENRRVMHVILDQKTEQSSRLENNLLVHCCFSDCVWSYKAIAAKYAAPFADFCTPSRMSPMYSNSASIWYAIWHAGVSWCEIPCVKQWPLLSPNAPM